MGSSSAGAATTPESWASVTKSRGGTSRVRWATLSRVELGTGRTAATVFAGGWNNCALLDGETVKCWGANDGFFTLTGLGSDEEYWGDERNEMGDALAIVHVYAQRW
jgi:hypothetical protein